MIDSEIKHVYLLVCITRNYTFQMIFLKIFHHVILINNEALELIISLISTSLLST